MTASAPCGCDESMEWRSRALRAELAVKFARQHLKRILDKLSEILGVEEPSLLTEMRDAEGRLIGVSGGTEEQRQAAIEAATKEG